jgi:MFS family permease
MANISQDKSVYTNLETKVGSPRNMALVLLAALGMYAMQLTMANALSLRVATIDPNSKAASYSLAVSVSSLLLLITIPLGGALSDRTTSRMGRRRPWIIGGLGVALLGSAMIGLVDSIPR